MPDHPFFTHWGWSPNQATIRGRNQHVQVMSRNGQIHDFMLQDAIQVASLCADYEQRSKVPTRLRRYWADNSNGAAIAYIQLILDKDTPSLPRPPDFPNVTDNGQSLTLNIKAVRTDVTSDHFEANAESFYREDHFKD